MRSAKRQKASCSVITTISEQSEDIFFALTFGPESQSGNSRLPDSSRKSSEGFFLVALSAEGGFLWDPKIISFTASHSTSL